ncbi:hypothetical protein [Bacillus safensis]|uniref:hypothetical protein n=1 Tax=Bacillus safensis TaxID=561879 RepID=UPI003653468C
MSSRRPADVAALRGAAVGALTAALAVAGHGIGGGGYPTSAAWTLLMLCCAGVGALAGTVPTGSGSAGRLALLGALAGGQLLGHLALSTAMPHAHADLTDRGTAMLAAHAVASAVCAALILAAERVVEPITRTLLAMLRERAAPVWPTPGAPAPAPAAPTHTLLAHVLSRRGPPAHLA